MRSPALWIYLRERNWPSFFGYLLFVGMMAAGYYYNLTFVQLGLEDFGSRILGLPGSVVARDMAFLAVFTCLFALAFGFWSRRRELYKRFQQKLKIAFGVVLAQMALTLLLPLVGSEAAFLGWLCLASAALGIGVPTMFSMTLDFIPVQDRGLAAALITALAYFGAETFSAEWTFSFFRGRLLWVLGAGTLGLGAVAFSGHPWLEIWGRQHQKPEFREGRFVSQKTGRTLQKRFRIWGLIGAMFAVYFMDSLGFLRLLKVPALMGASWQSPLLGDRLFIALVHVGGALVAGVLYSALGEQQLFAWVFGIFSLTHLQYSLHIRATGSPEVSLAIPMLYALAVSLYTVLNFALWADLSTPKTISINAALGVALSAWTATFFSTGLALAWEAQGVPLERHIQIVDSLALIALLFMLFLTFFHDKEKLA